MKIQVWVTSQFVGYHRWKDAPADVEFLRNWHRHVFKVRLTVPVDHDNRAVEFFQLKRGLDAYLASAYDKAHFELSCEAIAADLLRRFIADSVEVSEDGENGAIVSKE